MKSTIAFPFLTLPDDVIKQGKWLIGEPGWPLEPAEDVLFNWDYANDLEVEKQISVDMRAAAEALSISENSLKLEAFLRVGTGPGRYPRHASIVARQVLHIENQTVLLRSQISSQHLSGRLLLEAGLVLKRGAAQQSGLSPRFPGSRLWSVRQDILLEDGEASRFPMESLSFEQVFPQRGYSTSPWYLWWQTGAWEAEFSSAVRLYINADYPEFEERVVTGDAQTLQMMIGSIAAQMIQALVSDHDATDRLEEFSAGTLGAQVRDWLRLVFPGDSVESVRSKIQYRPGDFHATVLAAMELGGLNEPG